MRSKRTWPLTASEIRDRQRVVDLVKRVGEKRLVWTVHDLRRAMEAEPRLRLEHSSQLHRHVRALDDALVTPVGKRLDIGEAETGERPSRARHQYVLTRRLPELERAAPEPDDLERVYYALWVAVEVLGVNEVPTRAVTSVLRNVEDLALRTPRNTLNHLTTLHKRNDRAVEKHRPDGSRWSLWRPVGPSPDHPHFPKWVEQYRISGAAGENVAGSGHATQNSIVRELVLRAIGLTRSSQWPAGRSVQISDIRAAAGADERARELSDFLRERGRTIGSVLGDLTKERITGRRRVHCPVVKVASPVGDGTYYDVPDEPGFERRQLVVPYRTLQSELADYRLDQLVLEYHAADRLHASTESPAKRAIAAVRRMMAVRELLVAERLLCELEEHSALLSKAIRRSVDEYRGKLERTRERMGSADDMVADATQALEAFGLDLDEVAAAERPLLTPHDYIAFVPEQLRRGLAPPEFLARVKALRRFPNPTFAKQTDDDPKRSARYCVDRVEALCYLAERYQGRVFGFLRQGADVLGRDFRHPDLARRLVDEPRRADRSAGLAALVLLGDETAVEVALRRLHESESLQDLADALYTLLIFRRIDPEEWPARIRRARERAVRDTVTQVVLAARTGRWLLQR